MILHPVMDGTRVDERRGKMKRLELIFENEMGKNVTYSLDEPIEPADPVAVNAAMDTIIEQNTFTSSGGDIIKKKAARIVERTVDDIDLDIEEEE